MILIEICSSFSVFAICADPEWLKMPKAYKGITCEGL